VSAAAGRVDGIVIRALERREVEGLWRIDRSEVIERMASVVDGALVWRRERHGLRGWPPGELERNRLNLLGCFDHGGDLWGAFDGEALVGAAALECRPIGRARDRLQLPFLHVGAGHRGRGLGRTLFERAAERARTLGARRLYVSATPSENTLRFYLGRGCRLAEEPDPDLLALEPEDVHLELVL